MRLCGAAVVCVLVCALAEGQNAPPPHITVYGTPNLNACNRSLTSLQYELRRLPYPRDWQVMLVCSETAWQSVVKSADVTNTQTAFTVRVRKLTVVNAAIFRKMRSFYRRTLSHEVGHVVCDCSSEDRAESIGNQYRHLDPGE